MKTNTILMILLALAMLVIGTVVVHDRQHRQVVVCRRPYRPRRVVEVAVTLDIDDDAIAPARRERCAGAGTKDIAERCGRIHAEVAVGPVVIPERNVMEPGEDRAGREAPVVILDERIELGVHACGGDRAGVPAGAFDLGRLAQRR